MKATPQTLMDYEESLKVPFPYFGGKSQVAAIVWEVLGACDHYLEPFFGSGAVLMARKNWRGLTETVCDKDGFVANVWRAIQFDPEGVSKWCDWPVNHNDLIARGRYLKEHAASLAEKLNADPDYYDSKIAGFWIWGESARIGNSKFDESLPHLNDKGQGIHRTAIVSIKEYIQALSDRLRKVRVAWGDWTKICGGNWQDSNWQSVGYFFDPPYSVTDRMKCYTHDSVTVAQDVQKWVLEHGVKKNWRIVLAGYFEEHQALLAHGWHAYRWKANGGYSNISGKRNENALKETLFLSPHCLNIERICNGR
jgi:DNA adenine methylase